MSKTENEWYEFKKPAVGSYNPSDNICWPDKKEAKIGTGAKGERTPSPDMRRALHPNIEAIKKVAPEV